MLEKQLPRRRGARPVPLGRSRGVTSWDRSCAPLRMLATAYSSQSAKKGKEPQNPRALHSLLSK